MKPATIAKADASYAEYMERFGPHEMWLLQEEPTELYLEELGPFFGMS